jgi:hypothetical protein
MLSSKRLTPALCRERVPPRADPNNVSTGAPGPLGILLPHPRDMWSPLARRGAMGALTTAPTPTDGTDMTVHNEQERGNRALTQHDPGHFTTTTSIPL